MDIMNAYGWHSAEGPHSCSYLVPRVLDELSALGVHRILDIGSGVGNLCAAAAAEGYDVVGIENDVAGVRISSKNYPHIPFYNFGVEAQPGDLLRTEKPFDAVMSTEVIEHLYSPHLLPIYAKDVLRDCGYLILTTPYHGYLKNLALSIFDKWDDHHTPLWHHGHIKFWSRNTITQLLNKNGFEVIQFGGVGRIPYLWKSMVVVARLNCGTCE